MIVDDGFGLSMCHWVAELLYYILLHVMKIASVFSFPVISQRDGIHWSVVMNYDERIWIIDILQMLFTFGILKSPQQRSENWEGDNLWWWAG